MHEYGVGGTSSDTSIDRSNAVMGSVISWNTCVEVASR